MPNSVIPSTQPQLKFPLTPQFKPWYSPIDMLLLGVFGGHYFYHSNRREGLNVMLQQFMAETENWWVLTRSDTEMAGNNHFGVLAKERNVFMEMGGRFEPWFLWYCHFTYGRTSIFDEYKIKQWQNEIKGLYSVLVDETTSSGDKTVMKQHLLQYGWDWTKNPATYL